MGNSTPSKRRRQKPPRYGDPDFPLGVHKGSGYFVKKVAGRRYYFGKVADDATGEVAFGMWEAEKDDLLAGRDPREKKSEKASLNVENLCFRFLAAKEAERDGGDLTPRAWADYKGTCKEVAEALGRKRLVADLTPNDFRHLRAKLQRPGTIGSAAYSRCPSICSELKPYSTSRMRKS